MGWVLGEHREGSLQGEKRKAYEPAGNFVDMPITGTTGKHLKFIYFRKISGEPLKLGPEIDYL